jgi:iron complex outermembrane receptor protein
MGGVINIITKKQKEDGANLSFQTMYGSYNTLETHASAGIRKGRLNGNAGIGYNRSDGHRKNMNFEQLTGFARGGYDLSDNWKTSVDFNLSKSLASNPGTVEVPLNENDGDIKRGMTSLALENEYENTSGGLRIYYNFGEHKINDGYRDGVSPPVYRFNSRDYMAGASLFQSYRLMEGNRTTAGVDVQRFGGKAENVFLYQRRVLLADESIGDMAAYLNVQQTLLANKLTMNAGIRYDYNEHSGGEWIPQVGLSYTPAATTVLKAIASKGYRNPTIREMYMFPPQNPDLLPERLMNYELSLLKNMLENRLNVGVNLFHMVGDNMIQTVLYNGKPLNINTGKVKNSGMEFSVTYKLNSNIHLTANYSYLDMKYKITGAPEHKFYAGGNYTSRKLSFASGIQYVNGLWTRTGQNPKKENFALWNARLNYKATKRLSLLLKSENLLNQIYEINAGYPMPGMTIFGGLHFNY